MTSASQFDLSEEDWTPDRSSLLRGLLKPG